MAKTQIYTLYDNEEIMHSSKQFPESLLSTMYTETHYIIHMYRRDVQFYG